MRHILRMAVLSGVICMASCTEGPSKGPFSVEVTPDMRERCHIVRFPQGWAPAVVDEERQTIQNVYYNNDYEFRMIDDSSSRFLAAVIVLPGYAETPSIYTPNKYLVDLSNPAAPVISASDEMWDEGAKALQTQKSVMLPLASDSKVFQFNNRVLAKSGRHWAEDRLSPDQRWIVLQSWEGRSGGGSGWDIEFEWGMILGYTGNAYWDIYNADTGRKILTIKGRYNTSNASGYMMQSFWLTERYFIIPLGERREECLVCEFGKKEAPKR